MSDVFACDLIEGCRDHVRFLRRMHKTGVTSSPPSLKKFHRYVNCWLPLVKAWRNNGDNEHGDENMHRRPLIPPPDVAWMWYCHRISPFDYEKYCLESFGVILDASLAFSFQTESTYGRCEMETRLLWNLRYPTEPFFSEAPETERPAADLSQESLCGYNLFDSCRAQLTFLWQVSGPLYCKDAFLEDGVIRYHKFLKLCHHFIEETVPLVPTNQIDLVWRTHILISVKQYHADCMTICGRQFQPDKLLNYHRIQGRTEAAFRKTCDLWRMQYDTNYVLDGAMYRGDPPAAYYNYSDWDPDYQIRIVRRRVWQVLLSRVHRISRSIASSVLTKTPTTHHASGTPTISWSDLLSARGADLWSLRKRALGAKDCAILLPLDNRRDCSCIKVVGSASHFVGMELKGMEKEDKKTSLQGKSLTQVTGQEWIRQRELVAKRALAMVKELSLQAVETVNWFDIVQQEASNTGEHFVQQGRREIVDLKHMVISACLQWVTGLFQGPSGDDAKSNSHLLRDAFLQFWHEIRARQKKSDSLHAAQSRLIKCIEDDNHSAGLFRHMFSQDISKPQASANCAHAMVAAFDATAVIVFWTLWNTARTDGAWEKCRSSLQETGRGAGGASNDELEKLAMIKQLATAGERVDISSLSYLGRAMVETVRVYPPVWTLPRFDARKRQYVQLDVAWTNGALDRDWDPDREQVQNQDDDDNAAPSGGLRIASFGLGKRHCPAGTAALFAAHSLISRFVKGFDPPRECEPGRALRSIYLGPTLCIDGPQYFELTSPSCGGSLYDLQ